MIEEFKPINAENCAMNLTEIFSFPLNVILALIWIYATVLLYRKGQGSSFVRFMLSRNVTFITIGITIALSVVMGLTLQEDSTQSIFNIHAIKNSWVFVLSLFFLLWHLLFVIVRGWKDARGKIRWRFLLNHCGLFIALSAGVIGVTDSSDIRMPVYRNAASNEAYQTDVTRVFLPYSLRLDDFAVDYYDNGTPSKYVATVTAIDEDSTTFVLEVNHPHNKSFGEDIYLASYDAAAGSDTAYCVVQIVNEPWRYAIFVGIIMMLAGAVLMFIKGPGKWNKWLVISSIVLAALFWVVTMIRVGAHNDTLVPALQSPWFTPHITAYMFAYSAFAIAFILAIYSVVTKRDDVFAKIDALAYFGIAFMTFGMLAGALWAKEAWGHYWSWDPKETWAAITWLAYLIYIHARLFTKTDRRVLCLILAVAFICLNMCWWGVNYLPSAQMSIHTYTK